MHKEGDCFKINKSSLEPRKDKNPKIVPTKKAASFFFVIISSVMY